MPAASGAEAEVPVCLSVHWWCRSVVTWGETAEGPLAQCASQMEKLYRRALGTKFTEC